MRPEKNIKGSRNFTLIELMIVITIIVILCSLLLPALQKAREVSKRSVCASNLKQIGMAFHIYTSDYNGFFPWYVDASGTSTSIWFAKGKIGGSMYQDEPWICKPGALVCPSNKNYKWGTAWETIDHISYGYNLRFGHPPALWAWLTPNSVKISTTKNPSGKILVADSNDDGNAGEIVAPYAAYNPTNSFSVGNRHDKKLNALWADNHSSYENPQEINDSANIWKPWE
jgi:prepilin-type processing-associated H-X9-DG protein